MLANSRLLLKANACFVFQTNLMDKRPPDKREPDKKTKDVSETKIEDKKPVKQQGN